MHRFTKGAFVFYLVVVLFYTSEIHAESIGINFVDGWPNPHLEGKTADGFSTWTDSGPITDPGQSNIYPNSSAPLTLNNSNGLITVEWASNNTWAGGPESTPDEQLYRLYLDDGETVTGIGCHVTITGLADWLADVGAASYVMRFYHCTDNTGVSFYPVSVRDGSLVTDPIIETVTATNMWNPGSGTRAYIDSSNALTTDTITITLPSRWSGDGNAYRGCLAAIKITSGETGSYARNPYPGDEAERVSPDVTLTWEVSGDVTDPSYNFYLGTSPGNWTIQAAGLTEASYSPPLDYMSAY